MAHVLCPGAIQLLLTLLLHPLLLKPTGMAPTWQLHDGTAEVAIRIYQATAQQPCWQRIQRQVLQGPWLIHCPLCRAERMPCCSGLRCALHDLQALKLSSCHVRAIEYCSSCQSVSLSVGSVLITAY